MVIELPWTVVERQTRPDTGNPESDGHRKSMKDESQGSKHAPACALARTVRIRREGLRRRKEGTIKINVDKMRCSRVETRDHRRMQAAQNRRKKLLAFISRCCRIGVVQTPAPMELRFLEGPPPGGFSVSRSFDSISFANKDQSERGGTPESECPNRSLPYSRRHGKCNTTSRCVPIKRTRSESIIPASPKRPYNAPV